MAHINPDKVAAHYACGTLLHSIRDGVAKLGKAENDLTLEDLAPVDEFHIGGRVATQALLDQLGLAPGDKVLDIGCGLGGVSRFLAQNYDCQVDGIDLTPEFIETGNELCKWVGMQDQVSLRCATALDTRELDGTFDAACMLHVGMNIADKDGLFNEIARVLKPFAKIAIYDVLRNNDAELAYPVPWANGPDTCAAAGLSDYRAALAEAGFEITSSRDQTSFANAFFAKLKAATDAADGPPPLGLHLVLGENGPEMIGNMVKNIAAGRISPVEIIAQKF